MQPPNFLPMLSIKSSKLAELAHNRQHLLLVALPFKSAMAAFHTRLLLPTSPFLQSTQPYDLAGLVFLPKQFPAREVEITTPFALEETEVD
jgi:hypothetical protein